MRSDSSSLLYWLFFAANLSLSSSNTFSHSMERLWYPSSATERLIRAWVAAASTFPSRAKRSTDLTESVLAARPIELFTDPVPAQPPEFEPIDPTEPRRLWCIIYVWKRVDISVCWVIICYSSNVSVWLKNRRTTELSNTALRLKQDNEQCREIACLLLTPNSSKLRLTWRCPQVAPLQMKNRLPWRE